MDDRYERFHHAIGGSAETFAAISDTIPAIVSGTPPLNAGDYLKLRRQAAGLSIEQVAEIATGSEPGNDNRLVIALVRAAEENRVALNDAQIAQLRNGYAFDPHIYRCLRDEVPAGRICSSCGCSWNDACVGPDKQPCAWVSAASNLCTTCAAPRLVKPAPPTLPERLNAYADQIQAAWDRRYAGRRADAGVIRPLEVDLMREAATRLIRLEALAEAEARLAAVREELQ